MTSNVWYCRTLKTQCSMYVVKLCWRTDYEPICLGDLYLYQCGEFADFQNILIIT